MKLTTVIASVNDNSNYYLFIPMQILFWGKFGIKFIAVFVGNELPDELTKFKNNIILWCPDSVSNMKTIYIAQNIRMYYAALIDLPENEMVMITDMDMLPANPTYYTSGLDHCKIEDFIYYRHVDRNQIYMCYNSAHPKTWGKIFNVHNKDDICARLCENYDVKYDGKPGLTGWSIDQEVMYKKLIRYPHLKVLNRPLKRLEVANYNEHLNKKHQNFLRHYDDMHFHRNFNNNISLIMNAQHQLLTYYR